MRNRVLALIAGVTLGLAVRAAGTVIPTVVFSSDFEGGIPPEVSGFALLVDSQGYAPLGGGGHTFGNKMIRNISGGEYNGGQVGDPGLKTTISLSDLPPHDTIQLSFLLAIIDSWDGVGVGAGPDYFNVEVDGRSIFRQIFDCRTDVTGHQTYVPPAGVALTDRPFPQLGFTDSYGDEAYLLGADPAFQNISHSASTVTIDFYADGVGWQGGRDLVFADESWGIGFAEVSVVPEPALTVLWLGVVGAAGRRRRFIKACKSSK